MNTLTVDIRSDEGRIQATIKDVPARKSDFQSFLLLDAITNLIAGVDTIGWEQHSDELRSDEFYNAVLGAIANHSVHDGMPRLPNLTAYDLLKVLIDDLHEGGYLNRKLTDEHGEAYSDDD